MGIGLIELDETVKTALARTYLSRSRFRNESDFKFELFHMLQQMDLGGVRLGEKVPGRSTCLLHVESKPENGNPSKADLLICNPGIRNRFNYKSLAIMELKKNLTLRDLQTELKKLQKYSVPIGKLYVISANRTNTPGSEFTALLTREKEERVSVLTRQNLSDRQANDSTQKNIRGAESKNSVKKGSKIQGKSLAPIVSRCIRSTLQLYGKGKDPYHGFFWRNYEHEETKGWTFPVEGDFNAHLYSCLRSSLPTATSVLTEYGPSNLLRRRIDFFIEGPHDTAAIEVKMNWDQFRPKYRNSEEARSEAFVISDKFKLLDSTSPTHTNHLVVIQGVDGYRSKNKAKARSEFLRSQSQFHLYYYDENDDVSIGPIEF